jgi:hypothetical protein
MKVQKVVRAQGEFAKVNEDYRDGDTMTIQDAGQVISGDFGDRHVFKISTKNGDKNLTFNQTSMNNLIDAFGDDTSAWVGKDVRAFVVKQMVGDGLKNVSYLAAADWVMTDDGKFVPEGHPVGF